MIHDDKPQIAEIWARVLELLPDNPVLAAMMCDDLNLDYPARRIKQVFDVREY